MCVFVFRHSAEVLSAPGDGPLSQTLAGRARTMEDVLPLLELWLARAQEPVKLKARVLSRNGRGRHVILPSSFVFSEAINGTEELVVVLLSGLRPLEL